MELWFDARQWKVVPSPKCPDWLCGPTSFYSVIPGALPLELKRQWHDANAKPYLVSRLRMSGTSPPFSPMSSCRAQGQLHLYILLLSS